MAGIAEQLRQAVLQAAIQGKLTEQLPEDGDARDLPNEGRESPRFQPWDDRPHLRVTLGEISKQLFFVYIHVFVTSWHL